MEETTVASSFSSVLPCERFIYDRVSGSNGRRLVYGFDPSPSMHIRCTLFDYEAHLFPSPASSLAALSGMKLTSGNRIIVMMIATVTTNPQAAQADFIRFSCTFTSVIVWSRQLLFELVSTGWKRLPYKET